jgi:hypothetical protein
LPSRRVWWANVFEGFADVIGRGIRYGEVHSDPEVQRVVEHLQAMSEEIAEEEKRSDLVDWSVGFLVDLVAEGDDKPPPDPEWIDQAMEAVSGIFVSNLDSMDRLNRSAEHLREFRRILEEQ